MDNKVFQVVHCYDTDGGFGDAIPQVETLCVFEDRMDAEAFVERFQNPRVYNEPYAKLWCGYLEIVEINIIPHKDFDIRKFDTKDYWWLPDERRF